MVTRCADALLRAYFDRPIEIREISVTSQDQHDLVRAVIQELRNPTAAMKYAGAGVLPDYDPGDDDAERCWHEMIDEVLR